MKNNDKDIVNFLNSIEKITERLTPARRSQDSKIADCNRRQVSALQAISRHGCLNMSKLASIIDVPVSTATRIVDQLVAKKLLQRKSSPQDARKVDVDFSTLGADIHAHIEQTRQRSASSMLSQLSSQERATFLSLLTKLPLANK